jgi:multiple sugar transport system ATP-binding protein
MATISLQGVSKRYADQIVVDGLTIDITDGEFVSLLGPSGCGKSTILNIVAGLIEPDEGAVVIGGVDVTDALPKERRIAMVFQDYALYPHMTVAGNLRFPLKAMSLAETEMAAKVTSVSQRLGIAELLDRLPKELSGGQRQRVALGRAIVREPSAFLMDEPLSNLDAKLRVQMRAELKLLSRSLRTTTLYVTHDQSEAMTLSDRILVLDRGVMQQFDSPLEVYNRPANVFVANFMGLMPMNFTQGKLESTAQGPTFRNDVLSLDLSLSEGAALADGHPALLGIRPEDVSVTPTRTKANSVEMAVEMIEHLGADMYVHLRAGSTPFIARALPDQPMGRDTAFVSFNTAKLHLFDPVSTKRLGDIA